MKTVQPTLELHVGASAQDNPSAQRETKKEETTHVGLYDGCICVVAIA